MNKTPTIDSSSVDRRTLLYMLFRPGTMLMFITVFYLLPPAGMFAFHKIATDEHSGFYGRRDSSGQAPLRADTKDAVIQVYSARAASWRGTFGEHTWVAMMRSGESHYTRMEVIGYAVRWGRDALRIRHGLPDGYWFGNHPTLLREIRGGEQVDALIDRIYQAAEAYPYNHEYKVWPGPNSNTFTAYLGRAVPELNLELPSTAIGKDYLESSNLVAQTPSGRGLQLSVQGYAGVLLGLEEGLELNLLGLTAGLDLNPPALKLPAVGRIGFADTERLQIP